jgi:hypothetical protein
MSRLLVAATLGALTAGPAAAQCWPGYPMYPGPPVYVPVYPLSPAVWGAPAPKPFPPPPTPYVPRPGVGLREEDDPSPPRPGGRLKEEPAKPRDADPKDPPKIPKVKLPPLPGDPIEPPAPGIKPPAPKGDPPADGATTKERPKDARPAVEQFVVPAAGNRAEPRAEVQVGFFNHTDREITLDVNGESVQIPSEQYVTLRVPRSFKWSEKGQKANDVAVPPDADGLEIVFRK